MGAVAPRMSELVVVKGDVYGLGVGAEVDVE